MKQVSSDFQTAFAASTMQVKTQVIAELGNNRFNDDQTCSASSIKRANRGIAGSIKNDPFSFWAADDAYNNKNRNSMHWAVCDHKAVADGSYRAIFTDYTQDDGPVYERGWWSANKSTQYDVIGDLNWHLSSFDAATAKGWSNSGQSPNTVKTTSNGYYGGYQATWVEPNAHWMQAEDYTRVDKQYPVRNYFFQKKFTVPITGTWTAYMVADDDGTLYINGTRTLDTLWPNLSSTTFSLTSGTLATIFIKLVNLDHATPSAVAFVLKGPDNNYYCPSNNSWYATDLNPGYFSSPEWVESIWISPRPINKLTLWTTEAYPNMRQVTVQYFDSDLASWQTVANNYNLEASIYYNEWLLSSTKNCTGLRCYINQTFDGPDFARISELQGLLVSDLSDSVINCQLNQDREEYVNTVPVGITRANTLTLQLDNIDQKFSPENTLSPYYPYIVANNIIDISFGINIGGSTYEYSQMGRFYVDTWTVDGDALTATANCRDFSKFMQDEKILTFGKIWQNASIARVLTDLLARLGKAPDEIRIDSTALRTFELLFLKDKIIWAFIAEVAFADQGMFGFDEYDNFFYQSYQALSNPPFNTSVYNIDSNSNLISATQDTELYVNSVLVNVSNYSTDNTATRSLWGAPDLTMSYANLNGSINSSSTTINVRQDLGSAATLWPDSGYLYIDNEIIQYDTRTSNSFTDLTRGFSDTTIASHSDNAYIGEVKYFQLNFDNPPALTVNFPFVTVIDEADLFGQPLARILIWEPSAFGANLAIGNKVSALTVLQGSAPITDSGLIQQGQLAATSSTFQFYTDISGTVITPKTSKQDVGGPPVGKTSATNKWSRYIRRYGKNEIAVENPWIQTYEHAQFISNLLIDEYKNPRELINGKMVAYPALQLADRITIPNYPQLAILNRQYNLVSLRYNYDGGLVCDFIAREIKP